MCVGFFKIPFFPNKTLDWMIMRLSSTKRDGSKYGEDVYNLLGKLKKIKYLPNIHKRNRWFGYYQRVGEEKRFWTFDEVIEKLRAERG